jgi:hypothetical protein
VFRDPEKLTDFQPRRIASDSSGWESMISLIFFTEDA